MQKIDVIHNSDAMRGADPPHIFGSESSIPAAKNIGLAHDRRLQYEIIVRVADHGRKRFRQVDQRARVFEEKHVLRDHVGWLRPSRLNMRVIQHALNLGQNRGR